MILTYVDSGVLIAALRGPGFAAQAARAALADPTREFASSDYVRLEVLPKPRYFKRAGEVTYLENFFASVVQWAVADQVLVQEAERVASDGGLNALDALHIAAAIRLGADEFVTTERLTKSIHRARGIKVVTIQP